MLVLRFFFTVLLAPNVAVRFCLPCVCGKLRSFGSRFLRLVPCLPQSLLLPKSWRPLFLSELPGGPPAVGDDDVVEDGSIVDSPELEAHVLQTREMGERDIVWMRDLARLPLPLVIGVVNLKRSPRSLIVRIVHHRRLPDTILLVIPLRRSLSSIHWDLLTRPRPWPHVHGIRDGRRRHPVFRHRVPWISHCPAGHTPVSLHVPRCHLFQINHHIVPAVWVENQ
mmetsp:Transcript_15312/g.36917  ORF Transcript_15312/g.36917 Transcript_15312/m.36917 type:complete len:224 (-) Transcript_15312:6-677(-)